MATYKLLLLPGDGIGPEVMGEVKKLIAWMNGHGMGTFETEEGLVGGSCYDAHKVSITEETMAKAHAADAVIFGSVGGPKWDSVPYDVRPEAGLLRLRKHAGIAQIHDFRAALAQHGRHVRGDRGLRVRLRRDVDELERSLGQTRSELGLAGRGGDRHVEPL